MLPSGEIIHCYQSYMMVQNGTHCFEVKHQGYLKHKAEFVRVASCHRYLFLFINGILHVALVGGVEGFNRQCYLSLNI